MDSFWIDASLELDGEVLIEVSTESFVDDTDEERESYVHYVLGISNFEDFTWDGDDVPDPEIPDYLEYRDYTGEPLFGPDGPRKEDVNQGGLGTCWLLAGLAVVSEVSQNAIRQAIIELPDGTFLVEWDHEYYRHDAELPAVQGSSGHWRLEFAQLGHADQSFGSFGNRRDDGEGSLWVAVLEKAVASASSSFWSRDEGYDAAEGGFPATTFRKLGGDGRSLFESLGLAAIISGELILGPKIIADTIDEALSEGKAVCVGTSPSTDSKKVYESHAYMVTSVEHGPGGRITEIHLFNPWNMDVNEEDLLSGEKKASGPGNDNSDGIVSLSPAEFFDLFTFSAIGIAISDFSRFGR